LVEGAYKLPVPEPVEGANHVNDPVPCQFGKLTDRIKNLPVPELVEGAYKLPVPEPVEGAYNDEFDNLTDRILLTGPCEFI
ncbi:MAG: hypothetical protein ACKO16_13860, partial [Gemmataceae bacterium]